MIDWNMLVTILALASALPAVFCLCVLFFYLFKQKYYSYRIEEAPPMTRFEKRAITAALVWSGLFVLAYALGWRP